MTASIVPQRQNEAMLFERSEESASLIQSLLDKAGVRLSEWVTSGTGWAEVWQRLRPQIVIIDCQLPRKDGLFCVEKIHGMDPEAQIIFMHSYQGLHASHIELQALSLGATSVVQKPLVPSRFLTTIQRTLRKRRPG